MIGNKREPYIKDDNRDRFGASILPRVPEELKPSPDQYYVEYSYERVKNPYNRGVKIDPEPENKDHLVRKYRKSPGPG